MEERSQQKSAMNGEDIQYVSRMHYKEHVESKAIGDCNHNRL